MVRQSIGFRLLSFICLISTGMAAAMILIFPPRAKTFGLAVLQRDAEFITQLVDENLVIGVQAAILDDGASIAQTLASLEKSDSTTGEDKNVKKGRKEKSGLITAAVVLSPEGEFIQGFSYDSENFPFNKEDFQKTSIPESVTYTQTPSSIIAFSPIVADGGVIGAVKIVFSKFHILENVRMFQTFSIVVGVIALLVASGAGVVMVRMITGPIRQAVVIADAVATGDLSQRLEVTGQDETSQLGRALNQMADSLQKKADIAKAIAEGNLSVDSSVESENDVLGLSLREMTDSLNDVMLRTHGSSQQLTNHSANVSQASQQLLSAATSQASSLEEINSSICEISSRTRENADRAKESNRLTDKAQGSAKQGVGKMTELLTAMERINEASTSIAKIIKVIDDIAFQTNLLALNAAVEAARAGRHGKGFAVVAEEVRNLAGRSAKAAQETADLIEGAVAAISSGRELTDSTAKQLDDLVHSIEDAAVLVKEISGASEEQASNISHVEVGLAQIETITQTNASSAQTTAETAQDLMAQVGEMNNILARFSLKDQGGSSVVYGGERLPHERAASEEVDTLWESETKQEFSL